MCDTVLFYGHGSKPFDGKKYTVALLMALSHRGNSASLTVTFGNEVFVVENGS